MTQNRSTFTSWPSSIPTNKARSTPSSTVPILSALFSLEVGDPIYQNDGICKNIFSPSKLPEIVHGFVFGVLLIFKMINHRIREPQSLSSYIFENRVFFLAEIRLRHSRCRSLRLGLDGDSALSTVVTEVFLSPQLIDTLARTQYSSNDRPSLDAFQLM